MTPVSLPPAQVAAAAPSAAPAASPFVAQVPVPGTAPTVEASVYTVRPGDTLWSIATGTGLDVPTLARANGLSMTSVLLPGRRLTVPTSSQATPAADASGSAGGSSYGTYVVRPGDSAWNVASRLGIDVQALLAANGLTPDSVLLPGKRLALPGGRVAARATVKASRTRAADTGVTWATVRAGDTLWDIAQRYGVSVTTLAKANGRSFDTHLYPGDRLRVAGSVAASAAAPSRSTPLSAAAATNLAHLNATPQPSRSQVRAMIMATAHAHGVDPRLALAIGWQESRWSQRAVSEVNAIGVMQCLPSTGEWVSSLLGTRLDLLDAQDNITCGVALLRSLTRSASSESEAIGAYYQGLASVRQRGFYEDTKDYVAAVLAYKSRM